MTHIADTAAAVPAATGESPDRVERLAIPPAYDDIARRAYAIYEHRRCEHGHDWEDWFQAERELQQRALHDVIEAIPMTDSACAAA